MKRGTPKLDDVIHFQLPLSKNQRQCGEPERFNVACLSGNWHVWHTTTKARVTCPKCLEALGLDKK